MIDEIEPDPVPPLPFGPHCGAGVMGGERDQAGTPDGGSTGSVHAPLRTEMAELRERLEAARAGEAEWRQLIETMPQIVWITPPDGWHTHFNRKWVEFTGLTLEESLRVGWNPPFHPDDREKAAALWERATSSGQPYEIEYRLRRADGRYRWMLGRAMPLRDGHDRIVKWFGTCTDIEELKRAETRVAAQARLLDLTRDAVVVHDLDHRILHWNRGATRIHGWSTDEAVGRRLGELVVPNAAQLDAAMGALLRDGEWHGELGSVDRWGRALILECRWTLLHDDDGDPRAALAVNTDVTERRQVEEGLHHALHHEATHDALTDLPNRRRLATRLEEALQHPGRDRHEVALVLCDLDDFKIINDALGHGAGDQVLCEVAHRLRAAVRERDLVARVSGDEFAILLEGCDDDGIATLTDRLLAVVPEPVVLDTGQPVQVGLSIGVARANPSHDAQMLLRDADATLYYAKRRGKRRAEHFDEELRVDVLEQLTVPQELDAALLAGGDQVFCLHQPEIDLATGRLFGLESLVRWRHPERGLLTPDRFVPIAETAGLTGQLFTHVLARSLAARQRWTAVLGSSPAVSVNLSARDLGDASLPGNVGMALARAEMPAGLLWLEVTESAIASAGSLRTLQALHELGVHLAIDDFGTGWSSFNRLADFPFDMLKIDRSFTSKLTPGGKAEHMVRATIVMAHALGMRTVAEGIETRGQLDLLVEMGCDIGQGFYFARPLPASEAVAHLASDGTWMPVTSGPLARHANDSGRAVRRPL